jgi:DNA-binding CsgD family transcriptional regulator
MTHDEIVLALTLDRTLTRTEIAKRLDVSRGYLSTIMLTAGARKKQSGRPVKFPWAWMAHLYADGHSDCEIARRLGCSPQTVLRARRRAGMGRNKRSAT